jgi:6-phosphogluconolactonase
MAPAKEPAVVIYVSNAESGDILAFKATASSGELLPLQRVEVGGAVMPLAISPDRRFLYAARRTAPLEALSFAIDPATGGLNPIGAAPLPANMAYLATDRSGRFLLSASYGEHQIAISPIGADGAALPAQQVLATEQHAHAVQTDPSNRFLFATNLGGGIVMQQHFDAATGRVTPNSPATFRAHSGAGPRHFVFHPHAHRMYLLNELDATVDVLSLNETTGSLKNVQTLSTMPPNAEGKPWAAEVRMTSDGRFLYTSERRSSTLAAFAVDPLDGRLTLIGHVPTQTQPRSFCIAPNNRFLFAVGQGSNRLSAYAIDADAGSLTFLKDYPVGKSPTWIEAVELPRT